MGYFSESDIERQAEEINKKYNYGDLYIKSLCYIYQQFGWSPFEMDQYHQPFSEKWWPEWLIDFEIYDTQSEQQFLSMIDDYFDVYTRNSRRKKIWQNLTTSVPVVVIGPNFVFRILNNGMLTASGNLTVIQDGVNFSDKYGNIWTFDPTGSNQAAANLHTDTPPMPGPDGGPTMIYDNSNDPNITIKWVGPDHNQRIFVYYQFPDGYDVP